MAKTASPWLSYLRLGIRSAGYALRVDQLTQSILAKAFRGELSLPKTRTTNSPALYWKRSKTQRTAAPEAKHRRRTATPS